MTFTSASTSPSPDVVVVRVMAANEYAAVRELSMTAFGNDAQIGELLDALRSSWAWDDELSFVATVDGQLVGQVLYTHAMLDAVPRLVDVLVLGPIGVRPDVQRVGIGSALITRSLATLAQRSEPVVFLEGHPTYYPRFGFEQGDRLGFSAPSVRIPPEAFMAYRLPSYEPWMTGALVYSDAVWRVDAVGLRDSTVDGTLLA
jgi:putative acetyltransferase